MIAKTKSDVKGQRGKNFMGVEPSLLGTVRALPVPGSKTAKPITTDRYTFPGAQAGIAFAAKLILIRRAPAICYSATGRTETGAPGPNILELRAVTLRSGDPFQGFIQHTGQR